MTDTAPPARSGTTNSEESDIKLEDMMDCVLDNLYEELTGGAADLPLPANVQLNFTQPGIPRKLLRLRNRRPVRGSNPCHA